MTGLSACSEKTKAAGSEEATQAGLGWNKWALKAKPRSVGIISLLGSGYPVSCCLFLPWPLCIPEVIEKFDYVFAENGTVQYKHGRLLSKQVSGPRGLSPGYFSTVRHSMGTSVHTHHMPCVPHPDHPEPPRGGAAAGFDQLLPPLHGPTEIAEEAVRPHPALCCFLLPVLGLRRKGRAVSKGTWRCRAQTYWWVDSCSL